MKKVKLFMTIVCCASLLLSSCSNMLESLNKAAEPETKKEVKAEEPPAQEPVTPGKSDNVSYTVEHWQQNIADDDYTKVAKDTQTLSGKIGEETKAAAKTYTGFTAKAFEQKTLSAAETSVIKIFYDRKIITYSFDADGGTWGQGAADNVKVYKGKYGASFEASPDDATTTAPTLHPEKKVSNIIYTFTGWDKAVPSSFGEKDLSFTAQWSISKYLYKVEHYLQNLTGNDYILDGETSTQALASVIENPADIPNNIVKDYKGFTFKEATISGGELIKIYYDRKITALTLNPNGGKFLDGTTDSVTINRKYESTFRIGMGEVYWPSREGYEFRGWAYKSDATNCNFAQELNFEVTDATPSSVTLYAIWKSDPSMNSTLNFVSGGDVEIVANGNIYVATPTIAGSYTYEWYLNDVKQSSETNECAIFPENLQTGIYTLVVKAISSTGIVYVSQFPGYIVGEAQ